jgi:hypothetical protein
LKIYNRFAKCKPFLIKIRDIPYEYLGIPPNTQGCVNVWRARRETTVEDGKILDNERKS